MLAFGKSVRSARQAEQRSVHVTRGSGRHCPWIGVLVEGLRLNFTDAVELGFGLRSPRDWQHPVCSIESLLAGSR